jgi:hypothetical protein
MAEVSKTTLTTENAENELFSPSSVFSVVRVVLGDLVER